MNACHKKTVKSRDGYISMHECGKNIFHSKYECAFTTTDSIREVSIILIEDILKYKLDFKKFPYCVADFQEMKRRTANIIINIVRINLQEKQRGNEKTKRTIVR